MPLNKLYCNCIQSHLWIWAPRDFTRTRKLILCYVLRNPVKITVLLWHKKVLIILVSLKVEDWKCDHLEFWVSVSLFLVPQSSFTEVWAVSSSLHYFSRTLARTTENGKTFIWFTTLLLLTVPTGDYLQ